MVRGSRILITGGMAQPSYRGIAEPAAYDGSNFPATYRELRNTGLPAPQRMYPTIRHAGERIITLVDYQMRDTVYGPLPAQKLQSNNPDIRNLRRPYTGEVFDDGE